MKNSILKIAFIPIFVLVIFSCKKEPTYPGWTTFNTYNSKLTSDYLNSIGIDKHGNIWVGTAVLM